MRVVVATEARFYVDDAGVVWSNTGEYGYAFWKRYLDVFEHVDILGRIYPKSGAVAQPVEGPGVRLYGIPGYSSMWGFALSRWGIKRRIQELIAQDTVYIARVPGVVGSMLTRELQRVGVPFGVEVVGDPYDVFAPGASRHPLRGFLRWWFSRELARQCQKAYATAYVTQYALQRRYPPLPHAFTTHYSSVELDGSAFVPHPRVYQAKSRIRLISVGSMNHMYKAQDILIRAVEKLVASGLDIELVLVGDGRYRREHEQYVRSRQLSERVVFTGMLPSGEPVRRQLDEADVFVLPSRQEGLPRAMIEAMARALPCIGSTVGGIPELLDEDYVVPPNDVEALAKRIQEVVTNPTLMTVMSNTNLARAQTYRNDELQKRRKAFYECLKKEAVSRLPA